jgi:serine phosphatase RsbU (regulator of sigma subunit)
MLIDDKGVITAHPNIGYLEYNATAGATGKKITVFDLAASSADRQKLESLVEEARSGKIGMAVVNLQGHTSLTAVAPIAEIGWMMVVSVNTSSLISMSDFIPLLVVLLLSLLVALVLIALLMDRMVLKPLGVMTRSAHLVAAGEYDLILPVDRKDEMGTLSSAFNEMAAKVKNYTENLEASVKERTSELIVANAKLSDANRQVMGSIRYARLIQDGLMPSAGILKDRLSSYSYFHRQRDTVGGDFLFLRDLERSDGFLLAVIDCEGHGVPGALMTVMVDSVLRLTVSSGASDDPAAILGRLDGAIRASLRQGSNRTQHVHGGMDIGLCVCLPKHGRLVFAGAGMPLYVRESDGSVRTVPGRKKAIGYAYRHEPQPFESHRLDTAGRAFFLITDGFMDQAGGSAGRAYGTKRFFDRVAVDGTGSLGGISWEKEFDDYRGPYAQRDDVLVIGFAL